jgi:hypothetical protein
MGAYGYASRQLAKALAAADRDPRSQRVRRWLAVLDGMATGRLTVGSREPVAGLPAWVTPEVVHGGFATGSPAAGGPLRPHETALAEAAGVPAARGPLFAWHLGDAGLAALGSMLDGGGYRLAQPEQAALLAVAWLLRAGDGAGALEVLDAIGPFADDLCFTPQPGDGAARDPDVVWREPAATATDRLRHRPGNDRVEAMREALTVWNPFADELLDLWLETRDETGAVGAVQPPGWRDRAAALIATYHRLAAEHTRCGKHRRPRENLAVLRSAAEELLAGELRPRTRGLLRVAVEGMLTRRGRPGSPEHARVRAAQAGNAAIPAHSRYAPILVARIAGLDPDAGIPDVGAVCAPVSAAESAAHGVPAGATVPEPLRRTVRRAAAGTVADLVAAGVIPSAEVLAGLVPQLAAAVSAAAYADPALRTLAASTHLAFSRRRSLLLLDLQHQVRVGELPWVRSLGPHRRATPDTRQEARETLRRLGELALTGFPATLLPNPLVAALATLGREAGEDLPWVEELAADIFMGRFSPKYDAAARLAGELLAGSLYARYYDLDRRVAPPRERGFSVAANGVAIERMQVLTTHNLAVLAGPLGVVPAGGWHELARRAFSTVARRTGRLDGNRRPLPMVKDIAYAWRQLIFYLSVPGAGDPRPVIEELRAAVPEPVRARLAPAVTGLAYVAAGGRFTDERAPAGGRRLLGWTTGRHWLLDGVPG